MVNSCSQRITVEVRGKVPRCADITLKLIGDMYDENKVKRIIFSAFAYFAQNMVLSRSKLYYIKCTNCRNSASEEVHEMSQYHASRVFCRPRLSVKAGPRPVIVRPGPGSPGISAI